MKNNIHQKDYQDFKSYRKNKGLPYWTFKKFIEEEKEIYEVGRSAFIALLRLSYNLDWDEILSILVSNRTDLKGFGRY